MTAATNSGAIWSMCIPQRALPGRFVRQCLSIRQVRSSGRGQSEASCDRRPAPTNRCAKAPDRTRRVLLWKTHSGGRHTIRHWGVCLAGLLSGFGQDCIDCAQRISGALRDFRAPVPACLFSKSTFWMVSSGSGGLPSILPLPRATLSPAMAFGYSRPFLLCERGEHRNHHVLERSS